MRQTGYLCSDINQNQVCTEAENRALEGRSGVLPLSFWSKWLAAWILCIALMKSIHVAQQQGI